MNLDSDEENRSRGIGGYYESDFESRIAIPRVRPIMLWRSRSRHNGSLTREGRQPLRNSMDSSFFSISLPPPAPRARSRVRYLRCLILGFRPRKGLLHRTGVRGAERILQVAAGIYLETARSTREMLQWEVRPSYLKQKDAR
jgi:hypothetical protein